MHVITRRPAVAEHAVNCERRATCRQHHNS